MNKKKGLTDAEKALFLDAVKNVKPLDGNKPTVLVKPLPANKPLWRAAPLPPRHDDYLPVDLQALSAEDWVGIEEHIRFNRSGLQQKLLKKITHGQMAIEARLDLHRLILSAALAKVDAFLHDCQRQGHRLVLIIHGKGKKSDKPILKNALNIWLRTQTAVLAFHSAQPKDGGAGAVYVLLKINACDPEGMVGR